MKKSRIVIIIFSLLIIINLLILILLINKKSGKIDEGRIMNSTSREYIQFKSLNVKNATNMSAMDLGYVSDIDMLHYANNYVTKFLPDIYAQINNNTDFTEEYFARKKATIYKYSHIYKYADFMQLIDTMKKSEINFDDYKTIEFISSTNNDNVVVVNCELTYEENKTVNLQLKYIGTEINETKLEN